MPQFDDPHPTDDEVAAALAAVRCLIEQEQAAREPSAPARPAWRSAAAIEAHGLPPGRKRAYASWASAERARRANRWSKGIVGL